MKETFVRIVEHHFGKDKHLYQMTTYNGGFGGYAEGSDFDEVVRLSELRCLMCVMEAVGRGREALTNAVRRNPLGIGCDVAIMDETNERE